MKTDPCKPQRPSYCVAFFTLFLPIMIFMFGFLILKLRPPLVPLILAVSVAGLMCLRLGYSWEELEKGMFAGVSRVHIALAILVLTGGIIGSWIACGTIPSIIYWGIKLVDPQFFLVSTLFLCLMTSMATGTSLGTVGTMGVAVMAIGQAFGFPTYITAGAVISGSWFGDKMSPVSDSSNICAAVCEVPLFSLIFAMLWSTLPALLISALGYYFIGLPYVHTGVSAGEINTFLNVLDSNFNVGFLSLVPPIVLIALAYMRYPVLPCLAAAILAAILVGLVNGVELGPMLHFISSGFVTHTGNTALDSILARGGVISMSSTIIMIMLCMCFGGMLEKALVFEVLLEPLVSSSKSVFKMVFGTVVSAYILLLGTGSVSLAQVVTGRAFLEIFKKSDIHPVVLSRSVEDSATVSSVFVPWSTHSLFIGAVLGVSTFEYAPYALFNYLATICTLLCAATGFGVWRLNGKPVISGSLAYHGMRPFTEAIEPKKTV